jgi:hypothetical protein
MHGLRKWETYNTPEYYSVIKKNEILLFTGKWMELGNITLNEVIQLQKDKCHMWKMGPNTNGSIIIYISYI